jgi:hypothetical protein
MGAASIFPVSGREKPARRSAVLIPGYGMAGLILSQWLARNAADGLMVSAGSAFVIRS